MTDKIIEKYKNMLLDLPNVTTTEHIESKTSNITTSWGAQPWDELMVSRDILANFYDGCIEAKLPIDNVKISTKNDQIIVSSLKTKFALKKWKINGLRPVSSHLFPTPTINASEPLIFIGS